MKPESNGLSIERPSVFSTQSSEESRLVLAELDARNGGKTGDGVDSKSGARKMRFCLYRISKKNHSTNDHYSQHCAQEGLVIHLVNVAFSLKEIAFPEKTANACRPP